MEFIIENIFKVGFVIISCFFVACIYSYDPILGFGVLVGGLILFLSFKDWFLALYFGLLILPIQKIFPIGPIDFLIGELFLLPIIFIGICIGLIKEKKAVIHPAYVILILLYLSTLFIGLLQSSEMKPAFGVARKEFAAVAFFYALSFMIKGKERIAELIDVLLVIATLFCLFGLLQYFTGGFGYHGGEENRGYLGTLLHGSPNPVRLAHSTFISFNFFVIFIEFFFPLAFMLLLTDHHGKIKYILITLVLFVSAILSHSRGGLMAVLGSLVACLILYAIFINPSKRRIIFGFLSFLLILFVIGFIYIKTKTSYVKSLNYTPREIIWESCWNGIKQSPIFGVGLSEVAHYLPFLDRGYGTHNNYIAILLSRGLWGLFSFLSLIIFSLHLSIKNIVQLDGSKDNAFIKAINIGAFASIIAFLIHSFCDDGYAFFIFQAYLFLMFWIISTSWGLISDSTKIK